MTLRDAMKCLWLLAKHEKKISDFEVLNFYENYYFMVHFQKDGKIQYRFKDIEKLLDTENWTFSRVFVNENKVI